MKVCPKCNIYMEEHLCYGQSGPHYAKYICSQCGEFGGWISKKDEVFDQGKQECTNPVYSAEKELVLAIGSGGDVPEWARPAVKYFRHPKEHGLNLTIADFPPATAPNSVERYNAWLVKMALGNIGLSDKYIR